MKKILLILIIIGLGLGLIGCTSKKEPIRIYFLTLTQMEVEEIYEFNKEVMDYVIVEERLYIRYPIWLEFLETGEYITIFYMEWEKIGEEQGEFIYKKITVKKERVRFTSSNYTIWNYYWRYLYDEK